MNRFHLWYCNSAGWKHTLQDTLMPAALGAVNLGDDVLEIGPGPGVSTDWLRERVPRLTVIEINTGLATRLKQRLANTSVTVVEGDATAMSFADGSFDSAVCFVVIHHVPAARQDQLLREACRVLRPGGVFAGVDSTPSLRWNFYHLFDDRNPIDPATFGTRLEAAGFTDVSVELRGTRVFFSANKPA